MNDSTREISPLRQRMLEDMRLRKLAPHTQPSYVRAVRRLAGYLRRPPDTATVEDLRNFQTTMSDLGAATGHASPRMAIVQCDWPNGVDSRRTKNERE
jgi:integrase/recombinase XerD